MRPFNVFGKHKKRRCVPAQEIRLFDMKISSSKTASIASLGREINNSAIALLRTAAERGDAAAQNKLGGSYYKGTGVAEDFAEAVKWWRKSAEQENADAQFSLGLCLFTGKGVEKNLAEAIGWFGKSAGQGVPDAQFFLGLCLANGEGVEQDLAQAAKWWRLAAEQNHEHAAAALKEIEED
jgi:TPR repeat protein